MQEERNRLRYVVSHSSMLTFIMSVYDVGRPHQSRVLADLPALQSRQLSDLASVLLMEGVVLMLYVRFQLKPTTAPTSDQIVKEQPATTRIRSQKVKHWANSSLQFRVHARESSSPTTCYRTASEKAERHKNGPSITSSAEAMALHKTSLPLLLPVTSSTLLHHSLTSRRKRGGTLGFLCASKLEARELESSDSGLPLWQASIWHHRRR